MELLGEMAVQIDGLIDKGVCHRSRTTQVATNYRQRRVWARVTLAAARIACLLIAKAEPGVTMATGRCP